ncbi:hypothetical protein HPB50_000200 [Hyalomma asiaticum]|uniref:Uncharacterized protein n=1 Tax=Hyalomma asiaticum TaxID=266040 RepID=A0ACB7TGA4_HYAAI|nr:hypothetical protein HPB50_000200 [Hyalomma asiaticum]
MRHATSAKHVENARKHRDKDGVLTKSRCTQSTLDFSRNAPTTSLQESVAKAEALFALTVVANSLPYTLADVATATYPHMFPDSQIAKAFQCGRKKVSYIISDGLGPYFKGKVVEELAEPGVFYTVMIDETPVPEMKVQQLDVLVRYFSVKAQDVVVEHLQSFHMGHATADELFSCVSDSLSELPKNNMVCFFSDGPNVMKCLKRKIKAELSPNMIDIGECGLHKVHNAFAAALDTFCQEVDSIVTDIHQYFKCATRHADIKDLQQKLGLPQLEFLRHLKDTNVELPANWKAKPELGSDTEKEMELWTPTQKKAFHVKARAFYITCTKYLVSRLPLDNRVLFHMRFLKPGATGDSYTKSVRFIANALPQVIPPNEVSTLTDEWLSLVCETADWEISDDVIPHWANVFLVKMPNAFDLQPIAMFRANGANVGQPAMQTTFL